MTAVRITDYQEGEDDWDFIELSDGREGQVSSWAGPDAECPTCDLCGNGPRPGANWEEDAGDWDSWIRTGDGIRICTDCINDFQHRAANRI